MKEYVFHVNVKVKVQTELSPEEAKEEFEQESMYNFDSTENVTVLDTEFLETEIKNVENDTSTRATDESKGSTNS
jgi:hypothetical protein